MNKKQYLSNIASKINIAFVALTVITIYEGLYWVNNQYSGLSIVMFILSGSVMYFAYILKRFFQDIANNIEE